MKLIIAGDFVPQNRAYTHLLRGDYSFMGSIKELTSKVDFSIVNLECPIVTEDYKPIIKNGPNLGCNTVNAVDCLKENGFDCVTLANNHIRDYGDEGVRNTLSALDERSINHVGAGPDLQESAIPLIISRDNTSIAIINCCESEFSIATDKKYGANPLDAVRVYRSIKLIKDQVDNILVITHGGIETFQYPTIRMKELYRFFIDAGADAVVNHHQHCYSGYEIYNGKPIFYGLGNFCFDRPNATDSWSSGYVVCLDMKSTVSYELHPYQQFGILDNIDFDVDINRFLKSIADINKIISDDDLLHSQFEEFMRMRMPGFQSVFQPITNRYLSFLYRHNLLPELYSKRQKLKLLDLVKCDSERECFLSYLENVAAKMK